jgi:hypothetical protein
MKKSLLTTILLLVVVLSLSAQAQSSKKDPAGKWLFNAPGAPEYYQSGLLQVNFADKKYSATLAFTGTEYILPAENVVFAKDSLLFNISIQDESVVFAFSIKDEKTMTGQATYSGGVVAVTLNKEMKKE